MILTDMLAAGWRRLLAVVLPDDRPQLVDLLRQAYIDEARDVVQLTAHAQRMAYPQFRDRLLRIAVEEQAHVQWLGEQIRALGGVVPQVTATCRSGRNSWECLRLDMEEERRDYATLLEQVNRLEPDHPEIAEGLRRMRAEERRHRDEILDMMLKSDPYALPTLTPEQARHEREKQAWLEQQKLEWWEQRQAAWEAAGRPMPWAEWKAQQELAWVVHELPNRETAWIRCWAEQELNRIAACPTSGEPPQAMSTDAMRLAA